MEHRRVLATYYVAPEGDDARVGTSADAAWETLQHAAEQVHAGDTVIVAPGAYTGFDLSASGTEDARIVFRGQPGATIVEPNARTPDGINLEGASYVTIEGFDVTGVPRAGIRSVENEFVVIRNNRTYDNGRWGIFSGFSEDLLIEANETSGSQIEHGIYVSNSADRPIIRNNRVWDNNRSGIQINADASEGGDGIIDHAIVEGNIIYNNGAQGGSAINWDGVQDSLIQNNLLYNNHASGISLYQIDGAEGASGNRVVNNTVIMAADGRWALNIQNTSTDNSVWNNIFYSQHSYRGAIDISEASLSGFTSDYNIVESRFTTDGGDSIMDLTGWREFMGQDLHSIASNPAELFVSIEQDDYRLRAGSPAMDAGTATNGPATDLTGAVRPQGKGWDIGAYESATGLPGDFDGNGIVDARDIDLLHAAVRNGDQAPRWDLNGDGGVSSLDAEVLIADILNTRRGDANLDGQVDAVDLAIWQMHRFAGGGGWGGGDFDGDGLVDGGDFHQWWRNRGTTRPHVDKLRQDVLEKAVSTDLRECAPGAGEGRVRLTLRANALRRLSRSFE